MSRLAELAEVQDLVALRDALRETGVLDIAEELARLDPAHRPVAFRLLSKDRALAVFEALEPVHQQELLEGLREGRVRELVEGLDPDDRARLVDEMPAKVARRLLAGLTDREREMTATLLGYPEDSAGRIMTPEYVNVRSSMTVADALAKIRRAEVPPEAIYVLPVTDDQRRLMGLVRLHALVMSPPGTTVAEIMDSDVPSVRVDEDREVAARRIQETDVLALPIVDGEDRLVGIVTVDDALDVLEAEETEDVQRTGGSEPLGRPYLASSTFLLARKRALWLLVLIIAATLTVNVLQLFEATLDAVVTLAVFIPLLIGTGGNSGSQASTVVIRAIAVGEVRLGDLPRIMWREARVGMLLGGMLASAGYFPVAAFFGFDIATVISLTLVTICTWATFVGSVLPLLAKRVGIDPAVVSAPLVTTLVDATGLVIYFLIARAILGI